MEKVIRNMLLFTIFLLPFAQRGISVFGAPVYLPEFPIGIATFLYGISLYGRKTGIRSLPRLEMLGIALFVLGAIISSLSVGLNVQELGSIKSWFIFPIVFGLLVIRSFRTESERKSILLYWFFVIVCVAFISLLPLPFVVRTYDGRLASFFTSPNHLAFFFEPGILIGAYFCLESVREHAVRKGIFFFVETALIFLALLGTGSKGGIFAVSLGSVALFTLSFFPKRLVFRCFVALSVFAIFLIGVCFLADIPKNLESGEVRNSLASRVMIWNASIRIIRDHPVYGIGLRTFEQEYLALQPEFPPYLEWAVPHPHNLVLAIWLQTGIVGLFGFLLLIGLILQSLWNGRGNVVMVSGESILFLAFLVAFLFHGLVDTPFFRNDLSLQFFLVVGLILSFQSIGNQDGISERTAR